jgi:hypothetical protein
MLANPHALDRFFFLLVLGRTPQQQRTRKAISKATSKASKARQSITCSPHVKHEAQARQTWLARWTYADVC